MRQQNDIIQDILAELSQHLYNIKASTSAPMIEVRTPHDGVESCYIVGDDYDSVIILSDLFEELINCKADNDDKFEIEFSMDDE